MEFWASEVKSGETLKVTLDRDMLLHLSQANLGELKKGKNKEPVYLFVNVDGKKLVLGTLSSDKLPQQQFDLIFDQDFELSHSLKGGSVYFFGYKELNVEDEDDVEDYSDFDIENEDMPLSLENIGKPETKVTEEKSVGAKKVNKDSSTDKKVNVEVANGKPETEDDDSSDGDSIADDEDSDMDGDESEDDDDDSEDEEDESERDEPAKVEPGNKKRAFDTVPETSAAKKKAKVTITQEKTGCGVKVGAPNPSIQAEKKAPKSKTGGPHVCSRC